MEEAKKELQTFNIKKTMRFESKKRKMEALLNLIDSEPPPPKKVKETESLAESCNELKQELKRLTKKPDKTPCFYLKGRGLKARINFMFFPSSVQPKQPASPLFSNDIVDILLQSVIANLSPYKTTWCKLEHPQMIERTVLLVVEGLSKSDVIQHREELGNIPGIFLDILDVITPNLPFAAELCSNDSFDYMDTSMSKTSTSMFSVEKPQVSVTSINRLDLLLSPIQLVKENFPLPKNVYHYSNSEGFVFTKKVYSPVTEKSPIFAIDCEMCLTTNRINELTWIAVIDEKLNTVYETLVKPKARIINYLTKYSGITRQMLEPVTTTVEDVQKKIQDILPADAILCGQSLSGDLNAMKMMHPYIIDTSVIFNVSGIRRRKVSLKNLMKIHLDEVIQNAGNLGHSPIEDAVSCMKLVYLKLEKGLKYGDACLTKPAFQESFRRFNISSCETDVKVNKRIVYNDDDFQSSIKSSHETNDELNTSPQESEGKPNGKAVDTSLLGTEVKDDTKTISTDDSQKAIIASCDTIVEPDTKGPSTVGEKDTTKKTFYDGSFFDKVILNNTKIALIGSETSLEPYKPEIINEKVRKIEKSSFKKVIKSTLKHQSEFDLLISHLLMNTEAETMADFNETLKTLQDSFLPKTMFIVHISGAKKTECKDIQNGLLCVTLKN